MGSSRKYVALAVVGVGFAHAMFEYFTGEINGQGFLMRLTHHPIARIWPAAYGLVIAQVLFAGLAITFRNRGRILRPVATGSVVSALFLHAMVVVGLVSLTLNESVTIRGWGRYAAGFNAIVLCVAAYSVVTRLWLSGEASSPEVSSDDASSPDNPYSAAE